MTKLRTALLTSAITLSPALAHAHPGHPGHDGIGLLSGLAHPLNGFDHLIAMVAVGLWAVQLGGKARWIVPGAFVGAMSLGSLMGMNGVSLPLAEQGIAASLFVFGALIAMAARFSVAKSSALVALFALFHGYAHGIEAPASANGALYIAGFAVATAALHACGVAGGLGLQAAARNSWIRIAGLAVLSCGILVSLN